MEYLNNFFKILDSNSLIRNLLQNIQTARTDFTEPGTKTPELPYPCMNSETGTPSLEFKDY